MKEPITTYVLGIALGLTIAAVLYVGAGVVERMKREQRKWRLR